MSEVDHALSQLAFIQDRLAASTRFRGLAPLAVGATGAMALIVAAIEDAGPGYGLPGWLFVPTWVATAAVAGSLIAVEALARARRLHAGMADRMLASTLRLLLPFLAAGAAITFVIVRAAPDVIWILPGVWQMLIALTGFSAVGTLPKTIVWPAAWYFLCAIMTLVLGAQAGVPSAWMMGIPFGIGQLITAFILHRAGVADDAR
ncbi:hypothetical protein ACSBM8_14965 [Sphingomonas sp. ASY06-1R]|uniref:hypothetical protein n=1 Tax=Sphingomonas sp. ASY06-1R TaxID=3445771 RepID=UPI003FA2E2A2